jgi:tetratricopeptide (TPR) repeat protein
MRVVAALLGLAVLAGCGGALHQGATPGIARSERAVDGLTVGHRLMAAGEHELALRAYLRAAGERGADADVLSAIGSANLALGRIGQAELALRRALEIDPDFVPALNNLGVVLMERGETGEARRVFQRAFALDSGNSDAIRENLRLAIAQSEDIAYTAGNDNIRYRLVRRGRGEYHLISTEHGRAADEQ